MVLDPSPSLCDPNSLSSYKSAAERGLQTRLTHLPSPPGLVRAGQGAATFLADPMQFLWAPPQEWHLEELGKGRTVMGTTVTSPLCNRKEVTIPILQGRKLRL